MILLHRLWAPRLILPLWQKQIRIVDYEFSVLVKYLGLFFLEKAVLGTRDEWLNEYSTCDGSMLVLIHSCVDIVASYWYRSGESGSVVVHPNVIIWALYQLFLLICELWKAIPHQSLHNKWVITRTIFLEVNLGLLVSNMYILAAFWVCCYMEMVHILIQASPGIAL